MGLHKPAGLVRIGEVWHIDKQVSGKRLCKSCETNNLPEAIERLEFEVSQFRLSLKARPITLWDTAAARYIKDFSYKRSIKDEIRHLKQLQPFIGHLELIDIDDDALEPFVRARKKEGVKASTINKALEVVRLIVNLCARKWKHPSKLYWMETAPMITMLRETDSSIPYPLDYGQQKTLFRFLAPHVARMALFAVNTGLRDQEICGFEWAWECETDIEEFKGRLFIIPGESRKARFGEGRDHLVVLNDIAKSVVDSLRGCHPKYVFIYELRRDSKITRDRLSRVTNTSWQKAWIKAGLPTKGVKRGVHNLRHTFGKRLRAAGISLETRRVLMGHKGKQDITTLYALPELQELLDAVQTLTRLDSRKSPELTLINLRKAS